MILRRITEHFKEQNWFAVGVDFLIVVVGILLAFQITEWAGARSDRARETQVIGDLLADLDIDRAQYANTIAIDKYRVGAANASLVGAGLPPIEFDWQKSNTDVIDYSFEMSNLASFPASRLDRLWSDLVLGYHPTPSTSTYDTMVGAGDIKVIRDREIVREIQAYHNIAQSVIQQNDKLLSIRENVMYIGASSGLAPYLRIPAEEYFRLVAADPQLAAAIRIMATFVIYHHGEVKTADASAAELQKRLQQYLGH
jgi:hypothetical protein